MWVVVVVTLASALAFSVSSSLKHASAGQVPDAQDLGARSLGRFVRATLAHPLWLGGIGADVVGLSLQVIALHLGALGVVQPLLISGLLFALLLRSRSGGTSAAANSVGRWWCRWRWRGFWCWRTPATGSYRRTGRIAPRR